MEPVPADTRTALLQAALACFAERGFDGTSIRMIANRARRPLSLLAHHFGNKEGLYLEVFKLIFESTIGGDRIAQTPAGPEEAERLLGAQIHAIFLDTLQQGGHDNTLQDYGARLWLQEIRSPRPSLTPLLHDFMKPIIETIRACIQTLRPDLTEAEVAFTGISIVGQITGHSLMRGLNQVVWDGMARDQDPGQAAEQLLGLCLHGLRGRQPSLG
jgi:AcrR family transcriptional regulator